MSDYRAIATVTAVIRDILSDSAQKLDGNVIVKMSSPSDLKEPSNDSDVLNLFLYQVTANNICHNLDLPTRNPTGKLMTKPKLALDLHYLLTVASKNDELKAQLMLSSAMMALQENAIIPKDKIIAAIKAQDKQDNEDFLSESNLADQFESLKITLQSLSIEELTKLWSSFFQTGYRLSVAYNVSVVLLESTIEITPSLPVSKRQIYVTSLKQPVIEKIEPQIMTYSPEKKLVIKGRNLYGDGKVLVRLNDKEIPVTNSEDLTENQLSLLISEGICAGVKQVQVLQKIVFDKNDVDGHKGYNSNVAAFVLAPKLEALTQTSLSHGQDLVLNFKPGIELNQKVYVLIGDYSIPVDLSTQELSSSDSLESLKVTIPEHILTGTYSVRLRIDNADSILNLRVIDNVKDAPKRDPEHEITITKINS